MLDRFMSSKRFIIITPYQVYIGKTMEQVNEMAGGLVDLPEYKRIGNDFVVILNEDDLSFVQDKRRMSNIPWQRLGKKDNTLKYGFAMMLLFQLITLVRVGG